VRVIAGRLKGSTIRTPPGDAVRPTYDRVRESLFSIVEPYIRGAAVLDLFAGSGSLGIESLSRGASSAAFVESDPAVLAIVRGNVERLGLSRQCRLVRSDALAALARGVPGGPFDVVFVDPPYSAGLVPKVLELLGEPGRVTEGALVVVEHAAGDDFGETVGALVRTRSKRYGTTEVDFYEARAVRPGREEQT
jgi:16S rRNA (guanine(966)-N(2))-methyltransferase RsmD